MKRETFTREEVVELMWRFSRPWLDADRWSESYRAMREPFYREMIERQIQELEAPVVPRWVPIEERLW